MLCYFSDANDFDRVVNAWDNTRRKIFGLIAQHTNVNSSGDSWCDRSRAIDEDVEAAHVQNHQAIAGIIEQKPGQPEDSDDSHADDFFQLLHPGSADQITGCETLVTIALGLVTHCLTATISHMSDTQ